MIEVWKDIKGYEGLYQVSDKGNVRSLNYRNTGACKNMTLKNQNRGYLHVVLAKDHENKSFLVHRLVATAFLHCEIENMTVNHIDENIFNNNVNNLEWCSLNDNIKEFQNNHPDKIGRQENPTPINQFDKAGNLIRRWSSFSEIKNTLGFSYWSVKECCVGKRHSAYGYKWQFAT